MSDTDAEEFRPLPPAIPPARYVVHGTSYHVATDPTLVSVLERARSAGTRLRFFLGNPATGQLWGDVEVGTIGRSMGPIRVPLVIHNRRSMGGGALMDDCLVAVCRTDRPTAWMYLAPAVRAALVTT